jgi:hypothetical protein
MSKNKQTRPQNFFLTHQNLTMNLAFSQETMQTMFLFKETQNLFGRFSSLLFTPRGPLLLSFCVSEKAAHEEN